jgi:hypothetical protein
MQMTFMSCKLTDEVGYWLKGLLLAHDKADALLLTIAHKLGVADAALFPLFIPPSEKFDSNLHEAFQVFFTS